jgi:dTDP-4-dehydrorhamnose 3,5-epimerase
MSRFIITETKLSGLKIVERRCIGDSRGFFSRLFCAEELATLGWVKPIAQINHTCTKTKGTVRGMHYQHPPHAEIKLVTCLQGEVFDVGVDLRSGSPTFLQWVGVHLSADNRRAFLIPEGFAHGFQTLTDDVELLYCHSAAYEPSSEDGINPQDARLNIVWPLSITELSQRDASHLALTETYAGVTL